MSHLHRPALVALTASLLTILPAALAEEVGPIDAIVASRADVGGEAWEIGIEQLRRDHPAVARAIAQPDFVTAVADEEQASTHAFFAAMQQRNASAIRVEGEAFTVGITLAFGGGPADSGIAPDAAADDDRKAPGVGPLLLGVLAAVAAVRRASQA
jgi:hypothetical protein